MEQCPKCKKNKLYIDGPYSRCMNLECGYLSVESFLTRSIIEPSEKLINKNIINFKCPHCSKELHIEVASNEIDDVFECNSCNDTGYERVCDAAGSMDCEICNCKYGKAIRDKYYK